MQLEKGLVILEATAPMESFRESSATVTSHACVCTYFHVRSYVCICLEGVCLQRYNRYDCPPQSHVCVHQHVHTYVRALACVCFCVCVCDTDWSILPVFLFLVAPNVCGYPLVLCLGVVCGACCGRWFCAQPNVDTGRLVVVGHSLGGYHALRLASGVCMFIYLYIHIDTYIAHMFMCDCR